MRFTSLFSTVLFCFPTFAFAQDLLIQNETVSFAASGHTETSIREYLSSNNLDPIEGIYVWSGTSTLDGHTSKVESYAQVAIIKTDNDPEYDYQEILLSGTGEILSVTGWSDGDVIGRIRKTDDPQTYVSKRYKRLTEIRNQPDTTKWRITPDKEILGANSFTAADVKIEMRIHGKRLFPL